ncbi:hypothetical protein [Pontiella sulfatireligans]|uniref:SLA1 homology domain-containing protein n=1 Tax=Pontiella sulfatireligans TaxID=2750658 RepID=A0A6C2ULH8_9BACT|nr:hypothetical protein [Pontiella sulfatireligans]VGO21100.1 hypothetical protein SCARR_03169 [Pontiella sulfatireligans]
MKTMGMILSVLAILLAGIQARAELHTFTLQDGRALEAEVTDFNGRTGLVELKRTDGKRVKVKPDLFVEADQLFIKQWAKMEGFRSPTFFKVECKKSMIEKWKDSEEGEISYSDGSVEKETISETKFERFAYEVFLENRNDVALDNLKFEYRIFYEQGTAAGSGSRRSELVVSQKVLPGELKISRLSPKAKTVLKTESIVIHEKEYIGDFNYRGGDPVKESGDLKGIWLRIHAQSLDGKKVTRNVFEPASIEGKYAW